MTSHDTRKIRVIDPPRGIGATPLPPSRLRQPSQHDGLAVAGFVLSFLLPLLGLILSWVSVTTAHRDGYRASGLAVTGVWVSAVIIAFFLLIVIQVP